MKNVIDVWVYLMFWGFFFKRGYFKNVLFSKN